MAVFDLLVGNKEPSLRREEPHISRLKGKDGTYFFLRRL